MRERRSNRLRRHIGIVLLITVGALTAGGIAYATIPDSDGTFHACVQANNGAVRLIDPSRG